MIVIMIVIPYLGRIIRTLVEGHRSRRSLPPLSPNGSFCFLALFFVRAESFPKSPGIYIVLYIHYRVEITLTDKTRGKQSLRSQQINTCLLYTSDAADE